MPRTIHDFGGFPVIPLRYRPQAGAAARRGHLDCGGAGWAIRFETEAKGLLLSGDQKPLADYETLGREALLSIPTPDHYLPLLYVIRTTQQNDAAVAFPVEGVDGGSISTLTVRVGPSS